MQKVGEGAGLSKEISQEQKDNILCGTHSVQLIAHMGMNRAYQKLKLYMQLSNKRNGAEECIQKCESSEK
jgi:hypothetical protein